MNPASTVLTLAATLLVLLPSAGQAKDEVVPWTARPDPLPYKLPDAKFTDKTISLGKTGAIVYPSTTSPFAVVVVPSKAKKPPELHMIDLGRLEQIGQALTLDGVSAHGLHVSPFGDAIAAFDGKADKPTVKVWTFDGKEPRSIVIDEAKEPVEYVDFASQGKILTVKDIRKVKEVIFHRLFEVWDIDTGKRVSSFQYPLEYSNRWYGLSPARHYLALEHSTNDGYNFLIWDLTSGKLAGKLEVQPRSEGFGIPGGITFSPDGKEAALLWAQGGDGMVAKIHRFDIEKGVKKAAHILKEDFRMAAVGFGIGGMTTIQYLPDGRGWLLSGVQIAERETGKFIRRVGPAPGTKNSVHDRRFADPYHVTTLGDKKFAEKKLGLIELPKAELDAEFKNAGSK